MSDFANPQPDPIEEFFQELFPKNEQRDDLYILRAWLENRHLTVGMEEHQLYSMGKQLDFPILSNICGTNHLTVTGPRGKISVIRGPASFGQFEIYSLEGNLFEDIERYPDVKSAGERIYALLNLVSDITNSGNSTEEN